MTMPPQQPPGPPAPPPPGGPTPPPPGGGFQGGGYPGAQPAGVPRPGELLNRFLARLIDHVILFVVYLALAILFGIIFGVIFDGFLASWLASLLVGVIMAAVSLGYFGYLESNRGQTVGKMALKLRTYGPDGVSNPTMEQAVKRSGYLATFAFGIIPIVGPFIGAVVQLGLLIYIAVTLNSDQPNHQGWHDKFAGGTRVMQVG